jgi:hypothetical protein
MVDICTLVYGKTVILVSVSVCHFDVSEKNSNKLPEDGVDKRQNASELNSDQLRKKCALIVD